MFDAKFKCLNCGPWLEIEIEEKDIKFTFCLALYFLNWNLAGLFSIPLLFHFLFISVFFLFPLYFDILAINIEIKQKKMKAFLSTIFSGSKAKIYFPQQIVASVKSLHDRSKKENPNESLMTFEIYAVKYPPGETIFPMSLWLRTGAKNETNLQIL